MERKIEPMILAGESAPLVPGWPPSKPKGNRFSGVGPRKTYMSRGMAGCRPFVLIRTSEGIPVHSACFWRWPSRLRPAAGKISTCLDHLNSR